MTLMSIFAPSPAAKETAATATTTKATDGDASAVQARLEKTLDLVFTMDCTGSMGSYIDAAKSNIEAIVTRLSKQENADLRFGLVAYRDHPPQDSTFITKTFPFTTTLAGMKKNLASLSAQGGGDGPEAVATALKSTLDMEWREAATKVCILIADAPPHGLGEASDGFPNGSPDGVDPLQVLDQMGQKGICVYAVGCEPALGAYKYAREFMIACAERTEGQAVSLGSASSLADVIMGGAIEEMDLEKLMVEVEKDVVKLQTTSPMMSEEAVQQELFTKLRSRGHKTRQLTTTKLESNYSDHFVSKAKCLSDARSSLLSAAPMPGKGSGFSPPSFPSFSMDSLFGGGARGAPPAPRSAPECKVELAEADVSLEQVSRMYMRGKKKGMY